MKTQICCRPKVRWSLPSDRSLVVAVVSAFAVINVAVGQRFGNPTPGPLDMGNNDNLRPADFASNPFPNQFPAANFKDPFDTNVFRTTEDPSKTTQAPTTPTPFRRTQQEINRYLNKDTLTSFPEAPFNPNQGEQLGIISVQQRILPPYNFIRSFWSFGPFFRNLRCWWQLVDENNLVQSHSNAQVGELVRIIDQTSA